MSSVRTRLLPGLLCGILALVGLDLAVGLTTVGWVAGATVDAATLLLLGRALVKSGSPGPRPGDQVTLARSALVGAVAALVADSYAGPRHVEVLVGVAAVALALDAVDGRLARRTHTESVVGARFDMEVDAFLILVLSCYVARTLGVWVLAIGLARYALLAAGRAWPWLRRPTPTRYWAKVVAATQGITLTVVAADVLPRPVELAVAVASLALLIESFARQVAWLVRERSSQRSSVVTAPPRQSTESARGRRAEKTEVRRRRVVVGRGLTVLAVVMIWLALVLPDRLDRLTPGGFVQIPAEGLALTAAALLLPARPRQIAAVVVGGTLGVLTVLKVLDMGYYATLNRAFDPVAEWGSLGPALGVLRDSVGSAWTYLAVAGAVTLALGLVAGSAWASLRVTRRAAAHRWGSAVVVGVLGLGWVVSATLGLDVVPHTPVASSSTVSFAAAEVRSVATAARDRRRFAEQLAATDPYRAVPAGDLLSGLRGKDVVVAFVESYGRTAVQGSSFSPGIAAVLDSGTKALEADGFSSRSAFLTSPTFGGVSWLAHSTLQSGLWVDSRQAYGQLLDSSRLTLSAAFHRAGWRTVADVPSNTKPWPEGQRFYGYDHIYDATDTGYRGPSFSYANMPDQYTLSAFQRLELTPGHAPVMAEIDLVSSHIPWTPLPALVDWSDVGDGSVYEPMAEQGPTAAQVYGDDDALKAAYGHSIEYSLQSLISFVQHVDDDDLVLVLLGDHQPSPRVSGPDASFDVPITIVTRDAGVLDRVSSWQWTPGLRPGAEAPVWPMSSFRDRFLDAFSGGGLPLGDETVRVSAPPPAG